MCALIATGFPAHYLVARQACAAILGNDAAKYRNHVRYRPEIACDVSYTVTVQELAAMPYFLGCAA